MSSSPKMPGEPAPPFSLPDRYRIKRHLANGGMASVWCAEDLELDRSVAIKVLAQRFAHDAEAIRRFKREARAAARVGTHPHVVTVYDVDVTPPDADGPERAFIVMEYLAGGTVADAIRHDDIRRQETVRWLREAGSALDHAHHAGIVHRDIKPANFLLDRSRVLHVADFGIARLSSEETITSPDQLFGTAAYLSPEQALGREATSASDRYALAVVAFELLVGERPFHSPHFSAQARQHIEEPPPAASERNRTIPPAADAVLAAGLAKDPLQRPASADEFVRALESALGERRPLHRQVPPRRATGPTIGAPDALTAAARGGRGRASSRSVAATAERRPREAPTWAPTSTPPPPGGRRKRRRLAALAALLGVVAIVAVAVAAATGAFKGSSGRPTAASARVHTSHRPTNRPGNHAVTTQAAANSTPTAVSLEATGHRQMLAHNYTAALLTLKQAVSSADPNSDTYAYALYDLGRTMLLSGDPQGAITVLRKRLSIPIETATVQQTLDQALRAVDVSPQQTTPAPSTTTPAPSTSTTTTQTPTTPTTPTRPTGGAGITTPPPHGGHGHGDDNGPGDGHGPPKGNPGNGPSGNGPPGHGHGSKPGGGDGGHGNGPSGPGNGNGSGGAPPSGGAGLEGQLAQQA